MKSPNADNTLLNNLIKEQADELKKELEIVFYRNLRGYTGKGSRIVNKWSEGIRI